MSLRVRDLVAGYRGGTVLHGVDLDVPAGGAVSLLGRNGVGKTTLVLTLMGLVRADRGSIVVDGHELAGTRPRRRARAGAALVPQGRRIWAPLTNPTLVLLDEPSEGLAPAIIDQVSDAITGMLAEGVDVLLVEQDPHLAFAVADQLAVMEKGRIAHRASTSEFRHDPETAHRLLGVG